MFFFESIPILINWWRKFTLMLVGIQQCENQENTNLTKWNQNTFHKKSIKNS